MSIPEDAMRVMSPDVLRKRFRGNLNPQDWKLVQSKYAKALGQESENDQIALSQKERIDEAFHKSTGIARTGTMTDADALRKYAFKEHAQTLIDAEPDKTKIPTKRLQEILNTVVLDQAHVRSKTLGMDWLSGDVGKPVYELTEEEQKIAYAEVGGELIYFNDVPPGQRAMVIQEIEAANDRRATRGLPPVPITQKTIAAAWVARGKRQDPKK